MGNDADLHTAGWRAGRTMTTLTTATLALGKSLREAGADEKLAEAITTGVSGAIEAGVSEAGGEVATKADLTAGLADLKAEMKDQKAELINRIYLAAGLIIAAVFAMLRFMP